MTDESIVLNANHPSLVKTITSTSILRVDRYRQGDKLHFRLNGDLAANAYPTRVLEVAFAADIRASPKVQPVPEIAHKRRLDNRVQVDGPLQAFRDVVLRTDILVLGGPFPWSKDLAKELSQFVAVVFVVDGAVVYSNSFAARPSVFDEVLVRVVLVGLAR